MNQGNNSRRANPTSNQLRQGASYPGGRLTVVALVSLAAVLTACSQSTASASIDDEPVEQPPTAIPAPTAIPEPTAAPTESEQEPAEIPMPDIPTNTDSGSPSDDELVALGEELYQRTAGGIGCQACHGVDASGDVGPNILGKSAQTIQTQLESNEAMQFIILSDSEIQAVAAYLGWLESQPQPQP
ncbi:MAG: c-type cytochrome [Anaerolineales bacterium]